MLIVSALSGAGYSFSVFLKPFATEFHWTRAAVSGAVSMQSLFMGLASPFAGNLADRFGYRRVMAAGVLLNVVAFLLIAQSLGDGTITLWQLYLYLGLISGVGMGASYSPALAVVARWFGGRGTLALGVVTSGFGVGQMTLPLLANYMLSRYAWFWPFLITALVILVVAGPSLIYLKDAPRAGKAAAGEPADGSPPSFDLRQVLRSVPFWSLFVIYFFSAVSLQMVIFHVIAYATDVGLNAASATAIVTVIGAGTVAGRLGIYRLVGRVGLKYALAAMIAIQIPATLWLISARTTGTFYSIAAIYGIGQGALSALIPTITVEYFGKRWIGSLIGFNGFGYSMGSVVGPVLAGFIVDRTGGYSLALFIISGLTSLSLVINLALKRPAAVP